jgi:hypothetical protein
MPGQAHLALDIMTHRHLLSLVVKGTSGCVGFAAQMEASCQCQHHSVVEAPYNRPHSGSSPSRLEYEIPKVQNNSLLVPSADLPLDNQAILSTGPS